MKEDLNFVYNLSHVILPSSINQFFLLIQYYNISCNWKLGKESHSNNLHTESTMDLKWTSKFHLNCIWNIHAF